MGKVTFNDGTVIENYGRPYVIAEVNSSHNGDIEVAKRMIDAAVETGCDCVKFQSWTTDTLYSKTYYDKNPIAKRFVDKLSLSPDELKQMSDYCKLKGIGFSSTPYSCQEVDFLVQCNVPFIKISSMEINNLEFIEYIGNKQIPVVISTGMADDNEIRAAIKTLEKTGNKNIAILHCISIYPAELTKINLRNITWLEEEFPQYAIGFSDHTIGDSAAIAAVALGASVIEKHITLDSKKIGMDNQIAMEPQDLIVFTQKIRDISLALGSIKRIVTPEEYDQRLKMRRSIVATRDIEAGEIITKGDLTYKRPGDGIPPDKAEKIIGHKAKQKIQKDTIISVADIENLVI